MGIVGTGALVAEGTAARSGVAAFNVITLEHAEAIVAGAEAAGRPVILQISQNAVNFHGGRLAPLATAARSIAVQAAGPVALRIDADAVCRPQPCFDGAYARGQA